MYSPPPELPASLQGIAKTGQGRKGRRPKTLIQREYFADPPLTPEEAKEEKDEIYDPDLSFSERIQSCIQRFRSRRRLHGDRTLYFNEYLFLGGVDSNPGAYGGLGRQDLKDLTPAERREATATDIVYGTTSAGDKFYNGDEDGWTIDFAGVAAGFFSVTLVQLTSFEQPRMITGIDTVENFLRYVLHHDVCPEYEDNVEAALQVCEAARVEWPMVRLLYAGLPGQFNLAAEDLFCPEETAQKSWSFQQFKRPDGFDSKSVFFSAFALMDEPELFERLSTKQPAVVREFSSTLELVEIFRPSSDIIKRVKSLVIGDHAAKHVPVGKAMFKQATIKDDWDAPVVPWPVAEETMELFFDDYLLTNMAPGMKATLSICELDAGLRFVKAVEIIVPSFYTFLPQELMRGYKEPRLSNRPAPSVHDPDAEEKQHALAANEA
ncbi:hypothetical protein FZEAL_9131 [Fusarium zealandicum]|uniref:Argonaute-binding protein 1 n=1 Tax=Fusarium zealandicum TaxID=1053134 RepID=A0A8H4UCL5_9HYPO|nr:hypothetical protein FZEAL_9131 [Fusarium zealandicum]